MNSFGHQFFNQENEVVASHPLVSGSRRPVAETLQFSKDGYSRDEARDYTTAWTNPTPFELHNYDHQRQESQHPHQQRSDGDSSNDAESDSRRHVRFVGTNLSSAYRPSDAPSYRMHGAADQRRHRVEDRAGSDEHLARGGRANDAKINSNSVPQRSSRNGHGRARRGRGRGAGRRGRAVGAGRRGRGSSSSGSSRRRAIPPPSVRKEQALAKRREEGWNSRFAVPGADDPDGPDVTVANRDRRGFFDQGNIRKDEVFRITDQDTRSRAAALQEKRERAVVRRLARRAKLEVFMQETDRERARVHRQTEERAVHGVPAYMQPTFASIVREVDEQKRRSARAEAASRGPVASEGAAYLQPTFASRERNLQRGTALTRGLGRGHADTTRGRTQNHQARIREATKLAQFRENFERAEQYVAESVALHHELADNRLQIDTSPRNTKNPNSSRFDRKYYRRHEAASDPVELAKKKLEAACYGYGRNWSRLFQALDADGSGSLDAEEFRLGLRRVARVPRSQLSDRDIRHLFTAIDASSNGRMEATEFVEFMNLQMTPSWEIVQQREREQKLVVESGVKLQQAESTTESDSEEQFRLHHSPQTPQPRKHDRLGMQPQPQYPLAFTAPDEDQARMIQENAVALGSGVPPGSDPCCDLLSPAVAAQLSHRQRASVEALLKHLTKADYDILQHCVHKMIEPATRRAYAQNSHSPRGREKVIHSGEQRTQPVLGPDQLNAVLQYVQQTVDGINKVAKSVQARAALDGPRSPASSRVQTPSPNSTSMFNQQHGQASFPHGDNDADTPHSTSSSERVQSPGTGLKSSPSFILQNLDVLTDMIAADVVESSLLHSAAKMVVDAQGLHPSSSNRAHDSSTGGLRRLLFDMSQLEESEKRLAQRWGFDRSFREGGLPIETRRHAHGFDQPHSEDRGSATQVLRKLENAGLVPTVSRALPDGTITAFPEHWEAELEARQAAEVLAQEEDKSMARILHHVRQYKRAKVGLPTPSSSLSRQAYNAIFKPDANMDDFDGDAQQSDGENQHHQRPLQLADVLLRPELLEHLSGQILEEILAENAEEVAILMDDMTTSVIETL